jgi:hypothetical protein
VQSAVRLATSKSKRHSPERDAAYGFVLGAGTTAACYGLRHRDFGYDIADYCGIDPIFGTLPSASEITHPSPPRTTCSPMSAAMAERLIILLDLGHESETVVLPADAGRGETLLSTHLDREGERVENSVQIRRDEGLIIKLDA